MASPWQFTEVALPNDGDTVWIRRSQWFTPPVQATFWENQPSDFGENTGPITQSCFVVPPGGKDPRNTTIMWWAVSKWRPL